MERQEYEGHFHNTRLFWGLLIVLLGIILLLHTLEVIRIGALLRDYWPLSLILLGLYFILKQPYHRRVNFDDMGDKTLICQTAEAFYSNVFGDLAIKITSSNFQTGQINNVFGDMEIDLDELNVTSGEKRLHLSGVFGDITVSTPKKIPFYISANLVGGDINIMSEKRSGFSIHYAYKSEGYDEAKNRLNILISHVFGDIKIQ